MPFGIPGSDTSTSGGEFLGRINCDVRTGFWTITRRVQGADGLWRNETSAPIQNVTFLIDFGTLEVGYMKISNPPAFLLVPYGQPIPPQPQEMIEGRPGERPRRAFSPGFRVKVLSKATFGDQSPYYFSGNSKTLMNAVEALHQEFLVSPEAAAGKVPVVKTDGTNRVITKTPQGTNTFYAPRFVITQWVDRPAVLGERTVPPPAPDKSLASVSTAPAAAYARQPAPSTVDAAAIADDLPF